MKEVNDKENQNRRAYWFMVSPYEKEIINKLRKKEINLDLQKKATAPITKKSFKECEKEKTPWNVASRRRSLKRSVKSKEVAEGEGSSEASDGHTIQNVTPSKASKGKKRQKPSPFTEIIGGNVYWSDSGCMELRTVMTPRRIQLLDSARRAEAMDILWESSNKQWDSSEPSSENKITIMKRPLREIKQVKEEDKNEVFLYDLSPSSGHRPATSRKIMSSAKLSKSGSQSSLAGRKRRAIAAEKRSEMSQKDVGRPTPDTTKQPVGQCRICGPWNWGNTKKNDGKWGVKTCTANQESIYKMAIKQCVDENKKILENVGGLTQQVTELNMEVEKRDQTIDELVTVINKLTDGEFDRQLHSGKD